MRGLAESEVSHPSWNAFKKAVSRSRLTIAMMKLTLCCILNEQWFDLFWVGPSNDFQNQPNKSPHFVPAIESKKRCCLMQFSGNFDHGAWKSGDRLEAKRDSFEVYLSTKGSDYFEEFAELVAHDRNEAFDPDHHPAECMSEWMSSKALRNRGLYATCQYLEPV